MSGGSIDAKFFGISGNNTQSAGTEVTISGGSITCTNPCIYWPMEGELSISDGTFTGSTALEAKMGTIKIEGGTFTATSAFDHGYAGGYSTDDGSVLKFVGQAYGSSEGQYIESPDLNVTVSGATLISEHGNAISVYNAGIEKNVQNENLVCSVEVKSDVYMEAAGSKDLIRVTSKNEFKIDGDVVSSGNTTVTNAVLAKAVAQAQNSVTTNYVPSQGSQGVYSDPKTMYTLYGSLNEALANASTSNNEQATVELLKNVTEDVTVPKDSDVKLDLGSHTLTGGVENNGNLEIAGTGDLVGQVTGNKPSNSGDVNIVVATIGYKTYSSLEGAVAAVQPGQTITLQADAKLSSRLAITKDNVTLDLNGHTVSAASDFPKSSNKNDNQLVSIDGAEGVTIRNGSIVAGGNNYHTLNVWNSKDVMLEGLTLDHSDAYDGAPLIVGASGVTVSGDLNVVTGEHSWYGINVDSRAVGEEKVGATLAFDEGADVVFSGPSKTGVYIENTAAMDKKDVVVSFKPGVTLSSDVDGFIPVSFAKKDGAPVAGTVENPENAGLVAGPDGTFVPKPSTPVETGNAVKVEQAEGGKVAVTPTTADEGDKVTITATPDKGQEVKSVTVTTKDGKKVKVTKGEKANTWTFEMPDAEVTVKVTFGCDGGELCPTNKFDDVDADAWYHDVVDWAVEEGLLSGYADGTLGPDGTLSRAQLATVLWRQAGEPEAKNDASFADCDPEAFYAEAVAWADEQGIVEGYGDGTNFGPEDPVTREQLATILWRMAGEPEGKGDLAKYPDGDEVADYAVPALEWAVDTGVLSGFGDGSLAPGGVLSRAMLAAMLQRMAE